MMGPFNGEDHVILAGLLLSQYQRVTNGQTDEERCMALAHDQNKEES